MKLLGQATIGVAFVFHSAAAWAAPAGTSTAGASAAEREEAQVHFARGRELYASGEYGGAAQAFARSYAIVASPNAHLYLARSLREKGEVAEAYAEFEETVEEVHALPLEAREPYAKAEDAAAEERDELQSRVALLRVQLAGVADGTTVTVLGRRLTKADGIRPIPLNPGTVTLVVEAPGQPRVERSIVLAAGQRHTLALGTSEQPIGISTRGGTSEGLRARRSSTPPTLAFVAGAVGLAGFATFATTGLMSDAIYRDLEATCAAGCATFRQTDIDRGRALQTAANVGLAVGALGILTGAGFWLFGKSPDEPSPAVAIELGWDRVAATGRF